MQPSSFSVVPENAKFRQRVKVVIILVSLQLSGWENASALTLKVLNKLKSKLNELEELQVTNRQDIMNLDRDLQEVWRELESQGRLISDRNQRVRFLNLSLVGVANDL